MTHRTHLYWYNWKMHIFLQKNSQRLSQILNFILDVVEQFHYKVVFGHLVFSKTCWYANFFTIWWHLVICMVDAMLSPETNVNKVVVFRKTSICLHDFEAIYQLCFCAIFVLTSSPQKCVCSDLSQHRFWLAYSFELSFLGVNCTLSIQCGCVSITMFICHIVLFGVVPQLWCVHLWFAELLLLVVQIIHVFRLGGKSIS
jgi:hypothetical protein